MYCIRGNGFYVSSKVECGGEGLQVLSCTMRWNFDSKSEDCSFNVPGTSHAYTSTTIRYYCAVGWSPASDEARAHFGNKYYCERAKIDECQAPKKMIDGQCICPPPSQEGQGEYAGQCIDCGKRGDEVSIPTGSIMSAPPSNGSACMGGCKLSSLDFTYSDVRKNGVKVGIYVRKGSGIRNGVCTAGDSDVERVKPADPDAQEVEPQGPSDCAPGTTFGVVDGKRVCASGNGSGDKRTDFCKEPANQFTQRCSEGGSDYCEANPRAQACLQGSDRFCITNPLKGEHPSCRIGSEDYCKHHLEHPSCKAGTDEFCAVNPTDPRCQSKNADICLTAPESPACKKAQHCLLNPSDPACKTDTTDVYCKQFPNDAKCKEEQKGEFGGVCAGGFTCKGDAIQCAIAKEQHKRNCQFWDGSEKQEAYNALKSEAQAASGEGGAFKGREHVINVATGQGLPSGQGISIPDPGAFAGTYGTCPLVNKSVALGSVLGASMGSIEIPLDIICEYGPAIRAVVLFLAAMTCAWLIYGALAKL